MKEFDAIFGREGVFKKVTLGKDERNLQHEQLLKDEFGLSYNKGSWGFTSDKVADMSDTLLNAEITWLFVKSILDVKPFNKICLITGVAGGKAILVLNIDNEPRLVVATLNQTEIASFCNKIFQMGGNALYYQLTIRLTF